MLEVFSVLSPYAPLAIFVAAVLDIFFATGLVLYGAAMMSSIAVMHATGVVSAEMIIASSFGGTLLGNSLNYGIGRAFGETDAVSKKLAHPNIGKFRHFLQSRGLFVYMFACRFFALTRPLYALVLGSLEIKFHRFFLYEMLIAFFWVVFWLLILLQGEKIYFYLFG